MKRGWICVMMVIVMLLSAYVIAVSINSTKNEEYFTLKIENRCDEEIYGVGVEYYVERVHIGGVLNCSDRTGNAPLRSGHIFCDMVQKNDFGEIGYSYERKFGMKAYIIMEDGSQRVVGDLFEWTPRYGEEYSFFLQGNETIGYTLVCEDAS